MARLNAAYEALRGVQFGGWVAARWEAPGRIVVIRANGFALSFSARALLVFPVPGVCVPAGKSGREHPVRWERLTSLATIE